MWAEDAGGLRGVRGGAAGWTGQGGRGRPGPLAQGPSCSRSPVWALVAGRRAGTGGVGLVPTDGGQECSPSRMQGNEGDSRYACVGRRGARRASDSTDRRPDKGRPGGRTAVGSRAD